MRNPIDQFMADAKSIALNKEERALSHDRIFSQDFSSSAVGVELTQKEFYLGRKAFMSYMRSFKADSDSIFDSIQSLITIRFVSMSLVVLILVTSVGGGVAFAAEDTLPGDFLYPLKVNVTEPMRERMRLDPDIRARWAEKRIKRRLEETEQLFKGGQITEERLGMIQNRIERQQVNFERRMQNLPEGVPDEIRLHLNMRMQEHQKFLEALETGDVQIRIKLQGNPEMQRKIKMQKANLMHVIAGAPPIGSGRIIMKMPPGPIMKGKIKVKEIHSSDLMDIKEKFSSSPMRFKEG